MHEEYWPKEVFDEPSVMIDAILPIGLIAPFAMIAMVRAILFVSGAEHEPDLLVVVGIFAMFFVTIPCLIVGGIGVSEGKPMIPIAFRWPFRK